MAPKMLFGRMNVSKSSLVNSQRIDTILLAWDKIEITALIVWLVALPDDRAVSGAGLRRHGKWLFNVQSRILAIQRNPDCFMD